MKKTNLSILDLERAMGIYLGECCNSGEPRKAMLDRLKQFDPDKSEEIRPQLDRDLERLVGEYANQTKCDAIEDFDAALSEAYSIASKILPKYSDPTRRKLAIHCIYHSLKDKMQ